MTSFRCEVEMTDDVVACTLSAGRDLFITDLLLKYSSIYLLVLTKEMPKTVYDVPGINSNISSNLYQIICLYFLF